MSFTFILRFKSTWLWFQGQQMEDQKKKHYNEQSLQYASQPLDATQ